MQEFINQNKYRPPFNELSLYCDPKNPTLWATIMYEEYFMKNRDKYRQLNLKIDASGFSSVTFTKNGTPMICTTALLLIFSHASLFCGTPKQLKDKIKELMKGKNNYENNFYKNMTAEQIYQLFF